MLAEAVININSVISGRLEDPRSWSIDGHSGSSFSPTSLTNTPTHLCVSIFRASSSSCYLLFVFLNYSSASGKQKGDTHIWLYLPDDPMVFRTFLLRNPSWVLFIQLRIPQDNNPYQNASVSAILPQVHSASLCTSCQTVKQMVMFFCNSSAARKHTYFLDDKKPPPKR